MSNIIPFPDFSRPKDYGLGCPRCGSALWLNIGKQNWIVCDRHRLKDRIGRGLFSSWENEDDQVWRTNQAKLDYYDFANFCRTAPEPGGAA